MLYRYEYEIQEVTNFERTWGLGSSSFTFQRKAVDGKATTQQLCVMTSRFFKQAKSKVLCLLKLLLWRPQQLFSSKANPIVFSYLYFRVYSLWCYCGCNLLAMFVYKRCDICKQSGIYVRSQWWMTVSLFSFNDVLLLVVLDAELVGTFQ